MWIGTDGGGIWYWDRRSNQYTRYTKETSALSSNFVTNITKDHEDNLWIATWFGGVNRLAKGARSFRQYRCYNPALARYENNIWFIREDRNNGCGQALPTMVACTCTTARPTSLNSLMPRSPTCRT
ncbi:hypothetical protein MKQ70_06700 [Chitinophaga sedimenti]|nr:hypothetical protein [Chitinophaga sedimenti]